MNACDFRLCHDAWGRLVFLDETGEEHVGVEVLRAFPLSDPQRWIVVRDAQGRELATIEEPALLPVETRWLVDEALDRRGFSPRIVRVLSTTAATAPAVWEVETDRGPVSFMLKHDDDIRRLGGGRLVIQDAHGTRYQVLDTQALDARSRRLIEHFC